MSWISGNHQPTKWWGRLAAGGTFQLELTWEDVVASRRPSEPLSEQQRCGGRLCCQAPMVGRRDKSAAGVEMQGGWWSFIAMDFQAGIERVCSGESP